MNFLTKLIFFWKKPPLIMVSKDERGDLSAQTIHQVLRQYFQIKKIKTEKGKLNFSIKSLFQNKAFIIEADSKELKSLIGTLQKSRQPILIINSLTKNSSFILGLIKKLPSQTTLILNSDNKEFLKIESEYSGPILTFGFEEGALFRASDVKLNGQKTESTDKKENSLTGTNFKINYKGSIVPVWVENFLKKEKIYATLATIAVGTLFGLNLVEISQSLKSSSGIEKII